MTHGGNEGGESTSGVDVLPPCFVGGVLLGLFFFAGIWVALLFVGGWCLFEGQPQGVPKPSLFCFLLREQPTLDFASASTWVLFEGAPLLMVLNGNQRESPDIFGGPLQKDTPEWANWRLSRQAFPARDGGVNALQKGFGCGSKPMVPFWDRCTTILVYVSGD